MAYRFIQWIDKQQVLLRKQSLDQSLKCRAKSASRTVRCRNHFDHFFAVWKPGQSFAQLAERRFGDGNSAHRPFAGPTGATYAQRNRPMARIKNERVIHFGEIMILGSQPKDRDRRDSPV